LVDRPDPTRRACRELHFDTLAGLLADEFTVITYDRRGNGRSPVPAGW